MNPLLKTSFGSLFNFLLAGMLALTLALSPAFALPKSPFLGLDDASASKMRLLQPSKSASVSINDLLPEANFQSAASNGGLYSINNVSMFKMFSEPGECGVGCGFFLFIGGVTAAIGGVFLYNNNDTGGFLLALSSLPLMMGIALLVGG